MLIAWGQFTSLFSGSETWEPFNKTLLLYDKLFLWIDISHLAWERPLCLSGVFINRWSILSYSVPADFSKGAVSWKGPHYAAHPVRRTSQKKMPFQLFLFCHMEVGRYFESPSFWRIVWHDLSYNCDMSYDVDVRIKSIWDRLWEESFATSSCMLCA